MKAVTTKLIDGGMHIDIPVPPNISEHDAMLIARLFHAAANVTYISHGGSGLDLRGIELIGGDTTTHIIPNNMFPWNA